ncbi:NADPH-dependent FMN reductase [Pararhizobium sp. IMCC21322]|uniref:NADPH-dependent FMN reductase n=1 Tax=Pararhizobium sp. IMCC21322 TaxID=3067903 RepID=UPI00274290FC|nr:NADPH-dependent FMN reductase [Pararhizobium sp. IMCC21322]
MKILAISGSGRAASTNTAMLHALSAMARPDNQIVVFDRICDLPVFSPDMEAVALPQPVQNFADLVRDSDSMIVASPEYVRAIPGGLKNAIDWLVSRDEIIGRPIALMHASHRGDDMLQQLRLVLSTVSTRFSADIFLRFDLMKRSPEEILNFFQLPPNRRAMAGFLSEFSEFCQQ